jgi:RNA polymerase sigma-70 factor (ECF subfamily)
VEIAMTERDSGAHRKHVSGAMAMSEELRVERTARVAAPSLESIYRAHASFVFRSLLRLGVDGAEAEDLVQEVFLIVRRRIEDVHSDASVRAFLFSVTRGVVANWRRARERGHARAERGTAHAPGPVDPEADAVRREAVELVSAFLASLPEEQRIAFALCDIEGLSGPEVASATGEGVNVVYSRLRLARGKFREFAKNRIGERR